MPRRKQNRDTMKKILATLLLLLLALLAFGAHPAHARATQADGSDYATIDAYVQAQIDAASVPGLAIGIVKDGEVVHTAGFGRADSSGTLVTPQTPFIIGSVSKGFTALAVMQLVEQGKIDLDAPVQTYLHWFRLADPEAARQITIRMLLNQTSGLNYNDGTRPLWDHPGEFTLEMRVRQMADLPIRRAPGSGFEYSNYNYMILGLVVEAVTGRDFRATANTILFSLEMNYSLADLNGEMKGVVAKPSQWWFGFPIQVDTPYPIDAIPAGYIMASAEDMAKYLAFQQTGQPAILSAAGLAAMHENCVPSGGANEYCFGWVRGPFGAVDDALFHEGAAEGYYSVVALDPARGWGVVVLSNANNMLNAPANEIAAGILGNLVKGTPPSVSHKFWQVYASIDIVVLALTGLMIWSLTRLQRWSRKLAVKRPHGFGGWTGKLVLPTLAEFIIPFVVWIFLPGGAGFPMWKVMGIFQPDLTAWVFLMSGLFFARGLLRCGLAFAALRKPG
jgi:CubicO group peptidase (beta-lactamase class C family)